MKKHIFVCFWLVGFGCLIWASYYFTWNYYKAPCQKLKIDPVLKYGYAPARCIK